VDTIHASFFTPMATNTQRIEIEQRAFRRLRMGRMAPYTIERTPLQKKYHPLSRPIGFREPANVKIRELVGGCEFHF